MNTRRFNWPSFLRRVAVIAIPVAMQNLLTTTGSMVDTMMIASLGQTEIGAVGLCAQFSSLMFSGYWGFVGGGMLFFSQYWGARDEDGINRSYGLTLTCMLTVGMTFSLLATLVPEAVMHVIYTSTWSSFAHEKSATEKLINEGCIVISQHTDTIGPAIACEEATTDRNLYYVGYNQSMSEVAPGSSLVTARICWEPYVLTAVDAIMKGRTIEKAVQGNIHGTDVSAGFEKGWVEMVDLNLQLAATGTQIAMNDAIDQFRRGNTDFVFKGEYTGVDPDDPSKTFDLRNGYKENENTSYPLFRYILNDVVVIELE